MSTGHARSCTTPPQLCSLCVCCPPRCASNDILQRLIRFHPSEPASRVPVSLRHTCTSTVVRGASHVVHDRGGTQ